MLPKHATAKRNYKIKNVFTINCLKSIIIRPNSMVKLAVVNIISFVLVSLRNRFVRCGKLSIGNKFQKIKIILLLLRYNFFFIFKENYIRHCHLIGTTYS